MSKDEGKQNERLKNVSQTEDASPRKGSQKLVEVRKKNTAQDKDNEFTVYDKPFDEQMYESFDDLRRDQKDQHAD